MPAATSPCPGAIEYQGLHSDNVWSELHDPTGRVSTRELPVPAVTINFPMVDLTPENGPTRQIPGTQNSRNPIPNLADEPEWMKLSTVCPAPAGSGIFRDLRAWHGGTPESLARGAGRAEHRVLRAVVPQRGGDSLDAVRAVEEAVAARATHLALRHVREGREGDRRRVHPPAGEDARGVQGGATPRARARGGRGVPSAVVEG